MNASGRLEASRESTTCTRVWRLVFLLALLGCERERGVSTEASVATPMDLEQHCKEQVGPPRILEVTKNVFVAIGYDLGNTILVRTAEGNVVIDAMMSPARAREAKAALQKKAPGKIRALIYTHSHIDHVGAAAEWLEPDTKIWATDRLLDHFIKQYGAFGQAEARRGARQFGRDLSDEEIPCSALGKRPSFDADVGQGFRPPTNTFSGNTSFTLGKTTFELVEAHGETDDQLFVWIPEESALLPGDNIYSAFPNLYTIRGTRPRPVDAWINSLDAMRRRQPTHLVPSHTLPISGTNNVLSALRDYRDAIQWVRDEVVRGANQGKTLAEISQQTKLPKHLAEKPFLRPLYGQVDWSARAIFTNELGWFDGVPAALYEPPDVELAKREISLLGGAEAIRKRARESIQKGEPRFAAHFLTRLRVAGVLTGNDGDALDRELADALRAIAKDIANSNGRAYLLESARELLGDAKGPPPIRISEPILDSLPIDVFFEQMPMRLRPQVSDVVESLEIQVSDPDRHYFITIRHGVAELSRDAPLPGMPEVKGKLVTSASTWKRLAIGMESPALAIASQKLTISGDLLAIKDFLDRFEKP